MDHHFRAFSFVDRVNSVQAGVRISGAYAIPSRVESFPGSLVAEAVGQLAAWAAMAAVEFQRRPVAGLAGAIEMLSPVRPGQIIELTAVLDTVDNEAVGYGGEAQVNGTPVMRLHDCVGPMVPIEEFDDPRALRERFALLCGPGATPGAFEGVPTLALTPAGGQPGQSLRASFQVPDSAPLFADHFPRRAVFPGSLLMHLNLQLADSLVRQMAAGEAGAASGLQRISDVKLRTFIAPGELLECEARVQERSEDGAILAVETRRGKKVIGGARVHTARMK